MIGFQGVGVKIRCCRSEALLGRHISTRYRGLTCVRKASVGIYMGIDNAARYRRLTRIGGLIGSDIPCHRRFTRIGGLIGSDIPCHRRLTRIGGLIGSDIPCHRRLTWLRKFAGISAARVERQRLCSRDGRLTHIWILMLRFSTCVWIWIGLDAAAHGRLTCIGILMAINFAADGRLMRRNPSPIYPWPSAARVALFRLEDTAQTGRDPKESSSLGEESQQFSAL